MVAGSRFSRGGIWRPGANCRRYSKKVNRVNWLFAEGEISPPRLVLSLLFLLTSLFTAAAQSANAISPTVSVQALRVPAKARSHLEVAQREFSRLNLAGAEREIERALQLDSTFAAAYSLRAVVRLAARDSNRAIEDATRALALDPAEPGAYVALATAYNSRGEYPRAEASTERALTMRPDFWQARLELAKAFYGEGRLALALRELDELHKDFPDVHLVRANLLVRLNRREEAIEEFSQFLHEAPNDCRRQQVEQIVNQANRTDAPTPSRQ
jgi:tetratricopeptide (TPR) repeat protein